MKIADVSVVNTTVPQIPLPVEDDFTIPVIDPEQPQDQVVEPTMSLTTGMFLTIFIFLVLGIYCERRRRKMYFPYEWSSNRTAITMPWNVYHLNGFGATKSEKMSLLSPIGDISINMGSSRNRADTKYHKTKRKFPYFNTIPEEEEEGQESVNIQSKSYSLGSV